VSFFVLAGMRVTVSRRRRETGGCARAIPPIEWVHESNLDQRHHFRTRQRAGEGLERNRRPRHLAPPGARQGRGRIKYPRRCEIYGKIVAYDHTDKAFDDGERTVVPIEKDLSALPAEKSREIEVVEFVPSDQLDPITFHRSYFTATCCCSNRSSRTTRFGKRHFRRLRNRDRSQRKN